MRTPVVVAASVTVALLALPAGAAPPPQQQIAQLKRQVAALKTQVKQLRKQKADLTKARPARGVASCALRRYAATEGTCRVTRRRMAASRPTGTSAARSFTATARSGSRWRVANVVVNDAEPGGAVQTKFPWWRGVTGALRIEGRRLDGRPPLAPTFRWLRRTGFQASGTFPTEGCWEVRAARARRASRS